MNNQLFNKKIPTLIGIGLIILGVALTTVISKNQTSLRSNASNSQEPQNIKITNATDSSFTITYQTDAPATGSISYGEDKKLAESELDDTDKEKGDFNPKKIHSMSVKKLSPSSKYFLAIISGDNTFLNNGSPFEISTGPNIASSGAKQNIIKGKIVLPDGNPPSEALVYLSTDNSQLLSNITKDGIFTFSLENLRTDDLSSYFVSNNETVLNIFVTDGSLQSTALASLNTASIIPTITLSNDYNFTQSSSPIATGSGESVGFPSISPVFKNSKLQILIPKKNQSLTNQKPQFSGTSLPNEKVEITIHSDEEITTQVTSDNNGNWTYKPPTNLSPGEHTITIKTRDSSGILITLMQSFTVLAAEAPISPTPIPTLTPTSVPSPTAIIISPTPLPSPTLAPIESKGGLPETGSSALFLTIGGIISTISGIALLLLTHTIR